MQPETLQTAAPPLAIVSEEAFLPATSDEISLAELESLRAQVQAIEEAAVPQAMPTGTHKPKLHCNLVRSVNLLRQWERSPSQIWTES